MSDFAGWYDTLPELAETTPDSIRPLPDALQEVCRASREPIDARSHLVESFQRRLDARANGEKVD